ncbi:MAG: exosortase/archaeosortase family protein [Rubripirellula sp.]|nr:exosortase/archaeosortase family protein [Rubripirellula sp.]
MIEISFPELLSKFKWGILAFLGVLLYAYWPTLVWIEDTWRNEPDYSHGYLVPLLAGLLCWHRQDSFPGIRDSRSWVGLSLIALSIFMRFSGRLLYADFMDAWSIVPLIAGVVWFAFGREALKWSLPAMIFLLFMMPLPYRAETMLSWKLQGVATDVSTVFLRIFGLPAVAESHVIWIGDQKLMVEQACSGLRIFVGVGALAFFWAAMVKRSWIDRLILVLAALPLAIFVNAVRITVVGLFYRSFDGPGSRITIHDWTGYLMIPLAFGLLWLIKAYWERLYRPVEQLTAKDFLRAST